MYSLDFWLAVAILAAVPFWMAAYGGHVAAESISDSRRRLYVRLKFWGIGLVGLIVAFAYQYRVTKSDEKKQQATQGWQKSVTDQLAAVRDNPVYSEEQRQAAGKLQRQVEQGPKPFAVMPAERKSVKPLRNRVIQLTDELDHWADNKNKASPGLYIAEPQMSHRVIEEQEARVLEYQKQVGEEFYEKFAPRVASITSELKKCGIDTKTIDSRLNLTKNMPIQAVQLVVMDLRGIVETLPQDCSGPKTIR